MFKPVHVSTHLSNIQTYSMSIRMAIQSATQVLPTSSAMDIERSQVDVRSVSWIVTTQQSLPTERGSTVKQRIQMAANKILRDSEALLSAKQKRNPPLQKFLVS